ncbi:MAG: type III-A CRISPR-associated protein Csm2 [Deltaproteobacteria bacterium]|nr:type III-A CRISPR-associated protein Csm2 [Deltaproteobacteria bacterium]
MQPRRSHFSSGRDNGPTVGDKELEAVILNGDAGKLNEIADKLGRYYNQGGERDKLSSSQIRGILDHLQRMSGYDQKAVQLLRPKLAYAAGRHKGKVMELQRVTDRAIRMVDGPGAFENFKNFFEAIVAYHRYHGGK